MITNHLILILSVINWFKVSY